jgi:RNA polymerase sigma-70 factor (ECF subfamily)
MSTSKQKEFLKIYEPVHDRFERFCRARVYGDMDYKDLINETLLLAFQKMDEVRDKKAFLSYLFSVAVRILANNKRKKKENSDLFELKSLQYTDVNANTEADAEVFMLHEALAHLKDDQRESLILFEISGMSIKEIAVIQDTSESNVKQRLRRGRDKLRQVLSFESEHKRGEIALWISMIYTKMTDNWTICSTLPEIKHPNIPLRIRNLYLQVRLQLVLRLQPTLKLSQEFYSNQNL